MDIWDFSTLLKEGEFMAKVKASGTFFGEKVTITCEELDGDLLIDFDGKENDYLEELFRKELSVKHIIAGSYVPMTDEEMSNVINVLQFYTFEENHPEIIVEGEIETLPFEGGVVY